MTRRPSERIHDGACPPRLAQGFAGLSARTGCPRCRTLVAVFVRGSHGDSLAWATDGRGRPLPPALLAHVDAVRVRCPGCGALVRIEVAEVAFRLNRSAVGRPKRVDGTVVATPDAR